MYFLLELCVDFSNSFSSSGGKNDKIICCVDRSDLMECNTSGNTNSHCESGNPCPLSAKQTPFHIMPL